ncbi:MAG: RecX family transcriptional regulator [Anaerolineae bacterium]|nr:RecX family transcriptional regulator [Anaerolineae bacterium]
MACAFWPPAPVARLRFANIWRRKTSPPLAIEQALARLVQLEYLDDHAFARFWVENRNAFNPRGKLALRYELRQKGIDSAIIDDVLADQDSVELAAQAATKKLRSLRGHDPQTTRQKLGAFLARRGFPYDTVRTVLDQLVPASDDDPHIEE